MIYIGIWIGLIAANFSCQWLFVETPNWPLVLDRSYFQGVAIFLVWLITKKLKRGLS